MGRRGRRKGQFQLLKHASRELLWSLSMYFFFQPATNHVLGCPREPASMMEISTLAFFLALYCGLLPSRHCEQLNFYRKKGVFFVVEKEIYPWFAKFRNTTFRVNSPPDICSYWEVLHSKTLWLKTHHMIFSKRGSPQDNFLEALNLNYISFVRMLNTKEVVWNFG